MKPYVDALVRTAVRDAVGGAAPPISFQVESPRHSAYGDLTCDVGLVLARALGDSPHRLAATVVDRIQDERGWLADVTVDGPGFVNFRFTPAFWRDMLCAALAAGRAWGQDPGGAGRMARIAVLGCSPGDSRGGRAPMVAEALSRLLGARGWQVDAAMGAEVALDLAIGVLGGDGGGEAVAGFRAGLPAGTSLRIVTVAPVQASRDGERVAEAVTPAELGGGAVRFQVLSTRADRPVEVDLELAGRCSTDNPAHLVRFAHRRLADVLVGAPAPDASDHAELDASDVGLLRAVAGWPDVLEVAALTCEPHRVAQWAVETAMAVHRWVNRHRLLSGGVPPPARVAVATCLEMLVWCAMDICGVAADGG